MSNHNELLGYENIRFDWLTNNNTQTKKQYSEYKWNLYEAEKKKKKTEEFPPFPMGPQQIA